MTRLNKYLNLPIILGTSFVISGCIIAPNDQKNPYQGSSGYSPNTGYNNNNSQNNLSHQAKSACFDRFGNDDRPQINQVSPLKPGWSEVIIRGYSGRQVACTVDKVVVIADWVEM